MAGQAMMLRWRHAAGGRTSRGSGTPTRTPVKASQQLPEHYHSTGVIHETGTKPHNKLFCSRQYPEEIRRFDVVLEDPDHIFFCGDQINGKVQVDLDGCLTVQGIIVRFVGEAYVNVPQQRDSVPWAVRRIRRNLCNKNRISPSISDVSTTGGPGGGGGGGGAASCCGASEQTLDSPDVGPPAVTEDVWAKGTRRKSRASRVRRPKDQLTFRSHEKYFEHRVYVFGHKYSSKRERLWAGSHCFPFHYTLPTKLPSSFHGRLGYIRYFCEATLERSSSPNVQCRTMFSVSCIADVNNDPKADSGVSEQRSTNSCLFCCQKGTVIVSARLKRRAYVPGEDILVYAELLNMSNAPIHKSCAKLVQVVTYCSDKGFRSHVDEAVVCQVYRGRVDCGESDTWDGVRVPVPPLPPNSKFESFCKLMEIDYRLDFVVEVAGESSPLELRMPILVGTVPLHREFSKLQQPDSSSTDKRQILPHSLQVKYRHNLPAAFSEKCVWGERPVEAYYYRQIWRKADVGASTTPGTKGLPQVVLGPREREKSFAPKYVCYRRNAPDSSKGGFAHGVPQIVITQPPSCPRHRHPSENPRRHSAPGHLLTMESSPSHHLPDIPEIK